MPNVMICKDVRGRSIALDRDQWVHHICDEHPELTDNLDAVRKTIEQPLFIMDDTGDADRQNYYLPWVLQAPYNNMYLKVCVHFDEDQPGFVVTAYPTPDIKSRERQIWPATK